VTESLFAAEVSSSNVKAVALSRTPENVGENHDISSEAAFTTRVAGHIDMSFFRFFVCNRWFLLIVWVNVFSC